jgi:hypothetical protein
MRCALIGKIAEIPKLVILLTYPALRNVKVKDKPYKLPDGSGLFLLVNTVDKETVKYWRMDYCFNEKRLTKIKPLSDSHSGRSLAYLKIT